MNTENNTKVKSKFTSIMTSKETKDAFVALREEVNLSEKELIALIFEKALDHKDEIVEEAAKINAAYEAEKEAKKKERYELTKQAQKEVRAAARVKMNENKAAQAAAATIEG